MDSLRSVRFLAIVGIFAIVLAAIAPLSTVTQMAGETDQDIAMSIPTGAMDCKSCLKAVMTLGGCVQMTCQIVTIPTDGVLSKVTVLIRYKLANAARPPEWHIVPPISPG